MFFSTDAARERLQNVKAYRRLRYVTIIAPAAFVIMVLLLVLFLQEETSALVAFLTGTIITTALVPVFSGGVFDALEAMRGQIRSQQQELELTGEQLREHAREVARLRDRDQAGKDLSDDAIQAIYGVGLKLEACLSDLDSDPEEVQHGLDTAIDSLNAIIKSLRANVVDLEPQRAGGLDVAKSIRDLGSTLRANSLLDVDLVVHNQTDLDSLPAESGNGVLDIVEAAVRALQRHAVATSVTVTFETVQDHLRMTISDEAAVFDVHVATPPFGNSLAGLSDKAVAMDGSFTVDTAPGAGTQLVFDLPLHRRDGGSSTKTA